MKKKVRKRINVKYLLCLFFLTFWTLILSIPSIPPSVSGDLGELSNKSLDTKIGQMLVIGFRGLAVDDQSPIIQDIKKRNIGGVILFDYDVPSKSPIRNIKSPKQVKALTSALQKASSIPLFIAIDQEGGKVNRLKEKFGFPPSVSEQYLGSIDNPGTTRRFAKITARTLNDLGINLNFAPVVDLNTNSDNPVIGKLERSFSADPEIVVKHSLIVINTFHDFGVFSAINGNGNRKMTHCGNPNLTHPLVKKSIPILLFTAERIPE